jgi:hypothetical protein
MLSRRDEFSNWTKITAQLLFDEPNDTTFTHHIRIHPSGVLICLEPARVRGTSTSRPDATSYL